MPIKIIVEDPGKLKGKDKAIVELVVGNGTVYRLSFGELAQFNAPKKTCRACLKMTMGSVTRVSNKVTLRPENEFTVHLLAKYSPFWKRYKLLIE